METTPHDTLNPPIEVNGAPPPSPPAPHFDEAAIQSAQPAVPLAEVKRKRVSLLTLAGLGSCLLGGVLGVAVSRYQSRSARVSAPAATLAPQQSPQHQIDDNARLAASAGTPEADATERLAMTSKPTTLPQDGSVQTTLRGAFDEWIAATNARDIQRQMAFYNQTVNAFYLTRNVPREAVRAEKSRVFSHAGSIDIRAAAPEIQVSSDGRTATMRFHKKYAIQGGGEDRRGEVLQELRWVRTDEGWKIVSERDLRVID